MFLSLIIRRDKSYLLTPGWLLSNPSRMLTAPAYLIISHARAEDVCAAKMEVPMQLRFWEALNRQA